VVKPLVVTFVLIVTDPLAPSVTDGTVVVGAAANAEAAIHKYAARNFIKVIGILLEIVRQARVKHGSRPEVRKFLCKFVQSADFNFAENVFVSDAQLIKRLPS
jgi:hypothetical protein